MGRTEFTRAAALLLSAAVGAVLMPGCVIRLGQGGEGGTETQSASTTTGGTGGSAGFSPEEQAAIDALQNVDPIELARRDLAVQYTAYTMQGLVEQNGDPALVDEAAIQQFVDQYAPDVWAQAMQWAQSLDPSVLPLVEDIPSDECVKTFGCKASEACDFNDGKGFAACLLIGCGDGKCVPCPNLFDLNKLIVKGWCSYSCLRGHDLVGGKIVIKLKINREIKICLPYPSTF